MGIAFYFEKPLGPSRYSLCTWSVLVLWNGSEVCGIAPQLPEHMNDTVAVLRFVPFHCRLQPIADWRDSVIRLRGVLCCDDQSR